MDQFRFVGRIHRSNANTRLFVRAPRFFTTLHSLLVIGGLGAVSFLWATRPGLGTNEGGRRKSGWPPGPPHRRMFFKVVQRPPWLTLPSPILLARGHTTKRSA